MSDPAFGCPFRTFTSRRPHARFWQLLFGTMAGMETTLHSVCQSAGRRKWPEEQVVRYRDGVWLIRMDQGAVRQR
jgi:hypothetical protein